MINKNNNKKGITLIALIITIVIMLILAGITIGAINGGLFDYARKSKVQAEIVDLQEKLEQKKIMSKTKITDGEINTILGIESPYNESLTIEDGELVYIKNKWSTSDIASLEEMGINASLYDTIAENTSTIYYIANASTKTAKYAELSNVGTIDDFRTLVNTNRFTYDEAKLLEDIELNEGKYTFTNGEIEFAEDAVEYVPIGRYSNIFTKVFDGQNHTISGIYYNKTDVSYVGLFYETNGATIKNVGVINSEINVRQNGGCIAGSFKQGSILNCYTKNCKLSAANAVGGIAGSIDDAICVIKNCYNIETKISGSVAGGICGSSKGRVEGCFNTGSVDGYNNIGGIVGINQTGSEIFNCYNLGELVITAYAGKIGIAGANSGKIVNSYTTKGILLGTAENSYYLVESASADTSAKTANQMKTQSFVTLLNTVTTTTIDEDTEEETTTTATQDVWAMDTKNINNGFPILKWQK